MNTIPKDNFNFSDPKYNFELNISNKIKNIKTIKSLIKYLKSNNEIINKSIEKIIFCMLDYLLKKAEKYNDNNELKNINEYYMNTLLLFEKKNIIINTLTLKNLCNIVKKISFSVYYIKINTNLFNSLNGNFIENPYYKFLEFTNKNKINANYKENSNFLLISNGKYNINLEKLNKYRLYLCLFIEKCKSINGSIFKNNFCDLEKINTDEIFSSNFNYFPVNYDIDTFLSESDLKYENSYPFIKIAKNLKSYINIYDNENDLSCYLFLAYKIDSKCNDLICIVNEYSIDGLKKYPITIETIGNKYIYENYDLKNIKIKI